jgi:hypothetical protein
MAQKTALVFVVIGCLALVSGVLGLILGSIFIIRLRNMLDRYEVMFYRLDLFHNAAKCNISVSLARLSVYEVQLLNITITLVR